MTTEFNLSIFCMFCFSFPKPTEKNGLYFVFVVMIIIIVVRFMFFVVSKIDKGWVEEAAETRKIITTTETEKRKN